MKIRHSISLAALIASSSAAGALMATAWAQHAPQNAPVTKSLQEHPEHVTADDPRLRTFYDLLVEARSKGAERVDATLEKKVRETARHFPAGHGLDAKAWEDHVVDMAGQMLAIGKKDPKVFQSYDNFVVAMRGPQ
jgi:hypothetical protein